MKKHSPLHCAVILTFLLPVVFQSCLPDGARRLSYISFTIEGESVEGEFRIEEDMNGQFLQNTSIITPGDELNPSIAMVMYQDFSTLNSVTLNLPPAEGSVDLTDDYPYTMGITLGELGVSLIADEVFIRITRFESNGGGFLGGSVKEMDAEFTGNMTYENPQQVKEIHKITGKLVFSSF